MNTFVKVLLIALLVVVALKLLPFTLVLVAILGAITFAVLVAGASTLALLVCMALAASLLLAPLWIPILAVIGIVSLVRRPKVG